MQIGLEQCHASLESVQVFAGEIPERAVLQRFSRSE